MTTIDPQKGQTVRWRTTLDKDRLRELEASYGPGPFIVADYGKIPYECPDLRKHLEHTRWMRLADSKLPHILVSRALIVFDDPRL